MKLVAKARPVRIRIVSGDKEHSNIESLRQNYCFEDLRQSAIDGRLSNWLKQKDLPQMAEDIDALKSLLEAESVEEQTYIRFSCICLNISADSISNKEQLFDKWSDKYLGCPEYAILKKEVERIKVLRSKEEDNIRMKSDFEYAMKLYGEQNESRSRDEWVAILQTHSELRTHDGVYNWLMYNLTKENRFMIRSAEAGHSEALVLYNKAVDRFYGLSVANFRLFLDKMLEFTNKQGMDQTMRSIKKISIKTQEDQELANELLLIIQDFYNRFDNMYNESGYSIPEIPNIRILTHELEFYKGMIAEVQKREIAFDYYAKISDFYIPAKMRLEMRDTNNKKWSNENLTVTKLMAGNNMLNETMLHFDYKYYDRDRIAIILRFVLVHLFDTYTYEVR